MYNNDNSGFPGLFSYLFSYFWNYPLLCLNLIMFPLCNSSTVWIILILLGRNVDDVLLTRMTTLAVLLLEFSPLLVLFDFVPAL